MGMSEVPLAARQLIKKVRGKGREQLGATPYEGVDEMREAHEMGRHLRDHLHQLHGAGFHDAFCHGMSGGAWYDFLDPHKNGIANEFNNPNSYLRQGVNKVSNEFTNPDSYLRREDGLLDKGADIATGLAIPLAAAIPGVGTAGAAGIAATAQGVKLANRAISKAQKGDVAGAFETGIKAAEEANKANESRKAVIEANKKGKGISSAKRAAVMMSEKQPGRTRKLSVVPLLSGNVNGVRGGNADLMLSQPMPVPGANLSLSATDRYGGSMTGSYEGQGRQMTLQKKRIVGAGDGRRKRAEIVKRVMAEHGMKMIEASKYVKAHGLY
jgi:hypothetical protein